MLCFRFHHKFSIGSVGRLFFFFFFSLGKSGSVGFFFFFDQTFFLPHICLQIGNLYTEDGRLRITGITGHCAARLLLHLKQVCGYICRNKWRLMCLVVSTHYTVAMLLFLIVIVKDRKYPKIGADKFS